MEIANGSMFILNVCVFCFRVPRKERCAISPSLMRLLVDFPQINGESVPNAQCSLTISMSMPNTNKLCLINMWIVRSYVDWEAHAFNLGIRQCLKQPCLQHANHTLSCAIDCQLIVHWSSDGNLKLILILLGILPTVKQVRYLFWFLVPVWGDWRMSWQDWVMRVRETSSACLCF